MAAVTASGGVLSDAIVCGLNRDEIGLLGFLNEAYCQRLAGGALPLEELVRHPEIEAAIRKGLAAHNKANPNAAARITRILLQSVQPRADLGEITEKGYINQFRTQELRAPDIERLYSSEACTGKFLI
jgi:feruloyl-CoA synthase